MKDLSNKSHPESRSDVGLGLVTSFDTISFIQNRLSIMVHFTSIKSKYLNRSIYFSRFWPKLNDHAPFD